MYVINNDSSYSFDLSELSNAVMIESVKLLASKNVTGNIYLLLDVTGPSKFFPNEQNVNRMTYCGGGQESNFVWLKLDRHWKIIDKQSILYDSCYKNVDVADESQWSTNAKSGKWQIELSTINGNVRVYYDTQLPEKGLVAKEEQ